jgi:hypothetical protein
LSQNLETLLDAAGRLRSFPALVLMLVGDGTKRETLEQWGRYTAWLVN